MTKTHAVLYWDNKYKSKSTETLSNFNIPFRETITFSKTNDCDYYLKASKTKIPNSFYQINSNYNTFSVEEFNGGSNLITFQITEGNYNITELITEVQSLLNTNTVQGNTYTILLDPITGKVNVAFVGGSTQITIKGTSTLSPALGFETGTDYVITTNLTSPNVANVNFIRYIKMVCSSAFSNSFDTFGRNRTLKTFYLSGDRFDFVIDDNNDGNELELSEASNIKQLNIRFIDSNGNEINFNGIPSSGEIVISKYEKIQRVEVKNYK